MTYLVIGIGVAFAALVLWATAEILNDARKARRALRKEWKSVNHRGEQ